MILNELYDKHPGYQDANDDQSKARIGDLRKTKLTLKQINKLRTMLDVRAYEENYLQDKGFKVSSLHKKYSINENLMGATISGSEIDEWEEPSNESFVLCKLPYQYPKKPKTLTFS